jgi:hypothetical protein
MRYAIWNKKDPILTPIGEVLTAEQWIDRYPIAGVESITVVCAGGEINGGFFGTLGQMVDMYTKAGCDFSACETAEDKLNAIEAFEDAREVEAAEAAQKAAEQEAYNAERTAQALEAIASGATSESTAAMNALLTGEE